MLRKLSRRISNKSQSSDSSPEMRCQSAAAHDRVREQERLRAPIIVPAITLTPVAGETTPTHTRRLSWEAGDDAAFYTNGRLEALSLEPIIKPFLTRMRPTMASHESLQPPPSRVRPLPPLPSLTEHQLLELPHRPDILVLNRAVPGITATPSVEKPNPFDAQGASEAEIIAFPQRTFTRRKAVSYRTHRDLPLRVQAVRRAHQEEFSRQLAMRPQLQRTASRRGSAPSLSDLPLRAAQPGLQMHPQTKTYVPPKPLVPEHALKRVSSESNLHKRQQRQHLQISEMPRDFYLESAANLWKTPKPAGDMT